MPVDAPVGSQEVSSPLNSRVDYGHHSGIFQNVLNDFLLQSLPTGVFKCGDHLFFLQPLFFFPVHLFEHCCQREKDSESSTSGCNFFPFIICLFFFLFL